MNKRIYLILFLSAGLSSLIYPQSELKQTIRGHIVDKNTQMPLIGATVAIISLDLQIGTIANETGEFILNNVPVGRQSLQVRYIGYLPVSINNIILSSAKELILDIGMEQDVNEIKEIFIKPDFSRDKAQNEMASVSARSFTIEETKRYAGSLGDPSKMAANYAGVTSVDDNRNDIVIRGNSPSGLLWKLDGIEIPNPNHFGSLGSTGGSVTMLNSNLLANSDFYSGAFPSEYGNAISGVFDLKLRSGNCIKKEFWAQAGWNGFEFGAEGNLPLTKSGSYLFTYRYSIMDVMNKLGVDIGYNPQYQDMTLKVDFPLKNYSKLSIIGLGGISKIDILDSDDDIAEWTYSNSGVDIYNDSKIGVLGIKYSFLPNKKLRVNNAISITGHHFQTTIDTLNNIDFVKFMTKHEDEVEFKYSINTTLFYQLNSKNSFKTGLTNDIYSNSFIDSIYSGPVKGYRNLVDINNKINFLRSYIQWHHKFSNSFSIINGLNCQYLFFNNTKSYEPRIGLKWEFFSNHILNIGIGMHSQLQPRLIYYVQNENNQLTNKDLGYTKSNQVIIGYDYLMTNDLRLKIESYYQYLHNVPVKQNLNEPFSMLNSGAYFHINLEDSLVNEGTGRNYGIEFTLEKFFSKNYYFLITGSLFESKYTAYDKIERNTLFNGNFVFNILGGYEFKTGKYNVLVLGLKNTWAGGKRYIPFDIQKSMQTGKVIYNYNDAFNNRYNDYLRIDLKFGFRINRPKLNAEVAVDFQNLTNHKNIFIENMDVETGEIRKEYQVGFFPMGTLRIQF